MEHTCVSFTSISNGLSDGLLFFPLMDSSRYARLFYNSIVFLLNDGFLLLLDLEFRSV